MDPSSPYSASKAGGELMARAFARTFGYRILTTRGSNTYGPYQYPEKVIPLFITNLLDGLQVPLYGDGQNVRDWLYVDDHCGGIEAVLRNGEPGECYNIGGGEEHTNLELTHRLLALCGRDEKSILRHRPPRYDRLIYHIAGTPGVGAAGELEAARPR
jgi:dTDP-glucose 4,6-dehydratase